MSKYAVMPLSDYDNACDKIREKTETTGTIVSGEWANKVDEVYEAGVEAGKAQGGGGLYDSEINALLEVAPFFRKVSIPYDYYGNQTGFSGLFITLSSTYEIAVVLPFITEVEECAFDNMADLYCVIFTSKTPPTIGWQGLWSRDGGGLPPSYIFVPDESIEAYKSATNLAEYADRIQPLSEYNGEGWHGGNL